MYDFSFYLLLGWEHIINWEAKDHLLFTLVLASIYLPKNFKQVLVLVTAFTIGHSLTLALSTYKIINANSKWVELFIPFTIITTAIFNMLLRQYEGRSLRFNYLLALVFGLVHGLAFSGIIRFMLMEGDSVAPPLFGFNVGLELGQLVVVAVLLLAAWLAVDKAGLRRRWWVWGINIIAIVWAAWLAVEQLI